jgi:regulator of protease activity HflC (stomatin/prohibitin superfamily)
MNARTLIDIVTRLGTESETEYQLAAQIAEAQRDSDAKIAEALGQPAVAAAIRSDI